MSNSASIKPSEMVEGGAVPVDQNLTIKAARFSFWDYNGKAPQTTAARLDLVTDEGVEHTQYYSVSSPDRFVPSQDGKSVVAVGSASSLSKSSTFAILMDNLVNAGFPENKLGDDISVLDGLYAYWIGVPEPKRSGLQRTEEQQKRSEGKVILVPSQIHSLPWEKKGVKAAPASKPAAKTQAAPASVPASEPEDSDIAAKAIEFASSVINQSGATTMQNIAVKVFQDLAKDPDRDAIATYLFSPEANAGLLAAGYKINGQTITK